MLSKWPIRNKLLFGIVLLLVIVATLSYSGFHGVYAYRSLVRSLSGRATELPLAATFSRQVGDLRVIVGEAQAANDARGEVASRADTAQDADMAKRFKLLLAQGTETLQQYRDQLVGNNPKDSRINDSSEEWEVVHQIDAKLVDIRRASDNGKWVASNDKLATIQADLDALQDLGGKLPSFLHRRIQNFAGEVRTQYRTLIILTWITTVLAALLVVLLLRLFYGWIFRPLRMLVKGSRRVAGGEFGYRIKLDSTDEMAELADAMNDMTARFQSIRDGLDREVQERTKQVVRSEQLASVGFLAAGVAHEINNPLASIALCAESLEGRIQELLETVGQDTNPDYDVIRNYLRMIQDEAFRCKGITERLLDFSRMGDVVHQTTDLRELVEGVIDMVGHLGRYDDKHIELVPGDTVLAPVNAQEMKQVVLNLITNALDSLSSGGTLRIELEQLAGQAVLTFTDNGCGMTEEVQKHLFEPFFTRRRSGQGTGLGLSITYRIVADHGGQIDAFSEGPDKGSQFRVKLPLSAAEKEKSHRYQAA